MLGGKTIRFYAIFPKIPSSISFINRSKLAILQVTHDKLLEEYSNALKTVEDLKQKEVLRKKLL